MFNSSLKTKGVKYVKCCTQCRYQSLCFLLLECAGDITKHGLKLVPNCEDVKTHPVEYLRRIIQRAPHLETELQEQYKEELDPNRTLAAQLKLRADMFKDVPMDISKDAEAIRAKLETSYLYRRFVLHIVKVTRGSVAIGNGGGINQHSVYVPCGKTPDSVADQFEDFLYTLGFDEVVRTSHTTDYSEEVTLKVTL